ncbi:hypothetical protein [Halobacillus amylolyticus]|uniref:Uncharacterized protein n=1 Tax=Halobacillus amylolyticus TaxID=2932259 RepID=A0ABY4HGV0_9BACI|nr:hypothetical protein [Halobacillus amylolyticus]UOR13771.1 hypothetical protein MUO15_10180 [Halobacillus amylolyticus]
MERQKMQLEEWILQHRFPILPIATLVVFTTRTSVIRSSSNHTAAVNQVMRVENLPVAIRDIDPRHSESVIDEGEIAL